MVAAAEKRTRCGQGFDSRLLDWYVVFWAGRLFEFAGDLPMLLLPCYRRFGGEGEVAVILVPSTFSGVKST
jgi:hypothetical protein